MSCLPSEVSIYPAPENRWCFCSWFTVGTCISPQKADLLRHGGQGTLCPIDLKPDESLQASFKLSWAARHCHQLRMLRLLTDAGSYRVCTWPGQQITVMGAQLPPHLEKSGLSGVACCRAPSHPHPTVQDASKGRFSKCRLECLMHMLSAFLSVSSQNL